jgi:photosystem I protein
LCAVHTTPERRLNSLIQPINKNKEDKIMAKTSADKMPVPQSGQPPYRFRTIWALVLLAVNFIVAGIYFHFLNI